MRKLLALLAAIVVAGVVWWSLFGRLRPREVVVDLVARLPHATFSEGSPYRSWPVAAVPADDPRDEGVYLKMPSGSWIEWSGLDLLGPVTLELGAGAVAGAPSGEPGEARLEVTFRFDNGEWNWSRPIRRTGSAGSPAAPEPVSVKAAWRGEPLRSLRVGVTCADGEATWPAIFAPMLRARAFESDPYTRPIVTSRTAFDFVARIGDAEVLEQPEGSPIVRARFDPLPGVPGKGGPRVGLRLVPRSRVRFTLPEGVLGRFDLAAAVEPAEDGNAPVRIDVLVDGARVVSRTLDPAAHPGDRGWTDLGFDLPPGAASVEFLVDGGAGAGPRVFLAPCAVSRRMRADRLAEGDAPNVLVLLVDTLRADAVDETHAPRLTALARRGVRFRRARTFTSWTWPSVASLLTGFHPLTHGVHEGAGFFLSEDHDTIAERLARRGYTTAAVVTNVLLGSADRFDQGFETYVHVPYARARSVNELALRWVDATEGLARLLWLHYLDPHHPYRPPDPFFEGLEPTPEEEEIRRRAAARWPDPNDPDVRRAVELERRRYLAEVRYLDLAIGELLDALSARGFLDEAVVVLVADHGEEFLEHGLVQHGGNLYAETTEVPLFVAGFGDAALEARAEDGLVAAAGLPATLLHLIDGEPPSERSLWPSWFDPRPAPPFVGYTDHGVAEGVPGFVEWYSLLASAEGALHEAIWVPRADRVELYDLDRDPRETTDRSAEKPELARRMVERLRREIERLRAGAPGGAVEDEETHRRLEEMGYVGGK